VSSPFALDSVLLEVLARERVLVGLGGWVDVLGEVVLSVLFVREASAFGDALPNASAVAVSVDVSAFKSSVFPSSPVACVSSCSSAAPLVDVVVVSPFDFAAPPPPFFFLFFFPFDTKICQLLLSSANVVH
jgi:hypothetical protein